MAEFTELEAAVLVLITEDHPDIAEPLQRLLRSATLTERENTGLGFFTHFNVDRALPRLKLEQRLLDGSNVTVRVGDKDLLMGFLLWAEDGYPNCLEGFQYGTDLGEEVDLKRENLHALSMRSRT